MIAPTGRGFFRLSTSSTCRIHAVDVRYLAIQRVSAIFAALSTSSRFFPSQLQSSVPSYRHYATKTKAVSRPKAHTGRTASTTKKPAARTVKERTKTTATKTSAKPKIKAKAKPKPGATAKRKTKPKKKASKRPSKPKTTRTKKVLTEVQLKNKKIRELKTKALVIPTQKPTTSWNLYWGNYLKENKKPEEKITDLIKVAGQKFKNLTPEEREHWNHVANQNQAANQVAYQSWVRSQPVETVAAAHRARLYLRRLGAARGQFNKLLPDERRLKQPPSAFLFFTSERMSSGDMQGIKSTERLKLLGAEFKRMSAEEKEPYTKRAAQARADYQAAKQLQSEAKQ